MTVKVDIRVPVGLPVQETADFIAGCETEGFSGVGVHDHQHSGRDVFLTLALAAQRTSTLTVYPATTNPVTRHPGVLASLAHTLEEIAPGRVRLTVGPGYLAVGNIGQPRASLNRMREAILAIRNLLRGETVTFNGKDNVPMPTNTTSASSVMYSSMNGSSSSRLKIRFISCWASMMTSRARRIAASVWRLISISQSSLTCGAMVIGLSGWRTKSPRS